MPDANADADADANTDRDTDHNTDPEQSRSHAQAQGHKYSTSNVLKESLPGDVAFSDHAKHRYRERTPHRCGIGISIAYRLGEDIKHPGIASKLDSDRREPDRARVYRDRDGWGVVFVVVSDERIEGSNEVITTVVGLEMYTHSPSVAYLHSHGPHSYAKATENGNRT